MANYLPLVLLFIYPYALAQKQIVSVLNKPQVELSVGKVSESLIEFNIKEGFHVQADTVANDNLIPTSINFETLDGLEIRAKFPAYKKFHLNGTNENLLVFDQVLNVTLEILLSRDPNQNFIRIPGQLKYQACDSVKCLFPRTLDFFLDISVKGN